MPGLQPEFPISLSPIDGAYTSVKDLRDSLYIDFVNLLTTSPGGWPMRPMLGVGIKNYLFEPHTSPVWSELKQKIKNQVSNYLRGLEILEVSVDTQINVSNTNADNNLARITIFLRVERTSDILSVGVLQRAGELVIEPSYVDYRAPNNGTSHYENGEWTRRGESSEAGRPW